MVKKLKRKGNAPAAPAPKAATPGSAKSVKFKKKAVKTDPEKLKAAAAPGSAKPNKFKKAAVQTNPEKLKAAAAESSVTAEASASAPKTAPKPVEASPAAAKATPNGGVTQTKREEAANGGVAQINNEERKTNMKAMVKGKAEEKGKGEDMKSSRKEPMKGRDEERTKRDDKRRAGKEKEDDDERSGSGYIFMCSAKTKPECYRNGVFGLPRGKMDVVEKIRPGAKLFLYDFDLKLMYGVYKAETRGGLDLVRSAFDGKFPAQVKFSVDIDCLPIPESSFKHAIKENYSSKSRFTQELNSNQVHRLLALFKPVGLSQPAPQHIDERRPLIIEDRGEPYGYDERRSLQHVEERVAPINFHASPLEDHYKITHSLHPPLYDEPHQVPVTLGSHHIPHMRELQHIPRTYYHHVAPSHMDAMHERTAAEPTVGDPLLARDYGALPGELAARSQHVDELYRSYKLSTRTMDLHPGPSYMTSYENPRSVYSEILQRPVSTRVNGPSVPVSTRYSFAGPPEFR